MNTYFSHIDNKKTLIQKFSEIVQPIKQGSIIHVYPKENGLKIKV